MPERFFKKKQSFLTKEVLPENQFSGGKFVSRWAPIVISARETAAKIAVWQKGTVK